MAKEIFISKTYPFKVLGAVLALFPIFFPIIARDMGWVMYPFALLCLAGALFCWKFPFYGIEVNDSGIKMMQLGRSGIKLLDQYLVQPDIELDWDRIRSVTTTRNGRNDDNFITIISPYNEPRFQLASRQEEFIRNKFHMGVGKSIYRDYVSILKIVKARAAYARFDTISESIVRDEFDFRAIRPTYRWLALLVIIVGVLYLYFNKG